jgi:flagellar biosynthetic protein FliR
MLTQVFSVSPEWSAHFLLILARLSAAIVASPLFGARSVPAQAKIGFAVLLSLVVLPLQAQPEAISTNLLVFASLVGSEVLVGLAIGIAISLVFQTVEMAASIVSVQAGFGVAAVIDPLTGAQTGMLEQFYKILVTLLFFAINGHYLVVRSLLHTFEVVPPGQADLSVIAGERVVPFFTSLFSAAVQIALPAFGALILADIALALVGRSVPQLNVLIAGFPVKIGVGLLALSASMPLLVTFLSAFLGRALVDVNGFLVP